MTEQYVSTPIEEKHSRVHRFLDWLGFIPVETPKPASVIPDDPFPVRMPDVAMYEHWYEELVEPIEREQALTDRRQEGEA